MPPKPKFTKEQIVAAALQVVSEKGMEALTAKSLGDALGSSVSPIFTVFSSMKVIQDEVRMAAQRKFERCMAETRPGVPLFKQVGMQMALFGMQEPKLFQLLFMQENRAAADFTAMLTSLGTQVDVCLQTLQTDYSLCAEEARLLFENMWIYTFGLGALCATKVCSFSEEQLSRRLTAAFQALMLLVKDGREGEMQG